MFGSTPGVRPPVYDLLVEDPTGRAVRLFTSFGCEPAVGNGSLSAAASPQQQAELVRLREGE